MIAVLFATQREAAPFLQVTGAELVATDPLPRFECRDQSTSPSFSVIICGVGPEAAGKATNRVIDELQPTMVINAGICGAMIDASLGQSFWIDKTYFREADGTKTTIAARCRLPKNTELASAHLVTSHTAVFDDATRAALTESADLVDMEGAAIAETCAQRGVPCFMLKGVSDQADAQGHDSIMQHIDSVSRRVADHLTASFPQFRRAAADKGAKPAIVSSIMRFTKIEHTAFSVPLLFAGARLGGGDAFPDGITLTLIVAAALGARVYGMAVNRIFDLDLDRKNPRTANRELPSGSLRLSQAWAVALAGLTLYGAACAFLGGWCILLSPIPLIPLTVYPFLKRFTSLCHFGVGICLAQAPYAAFVAGSGTLEWHLPTVFLSLFTLFWLTGSDIVYALLDADFDRQHGVCSLPGVLGQSRAQRIASLCHGFAFFCACAMLYSLGWNAGGLAALVTLGLILSLVSVKAIPAGTRFFPISALAGIAGAFVALLGVNG